MAARKVVRAASGSPSSGMVDELPEWKKDWANANCFFCFEKTQHSKEACMDHATIAGRNITYPAGDITRQRQVEAEERRERCRKAYYSLLTTKNMRPREAIALLAQKEDLNFATVQGYVRARKLKEK